MTKDLSSPPQTFIEKTCTKGLGHFIWINIGKQLNYKESKYNKINMENKKLSPNSKVQHMELNELISKDQYRSFRHF